jgi:hypothetical protein
MAKPKRKRKGKKKNPVTGAEDSTDAAIGAILGLLAGGAISSVVVGIPLFIWYTHRLEEIAVVEQGGKPSTDAVSDPAGIAVLFGLLAAVPITVGGAVIGARRNAPKKAKRGAGIGAGVGTVLSMPLGLPLVGAPAGAYVGAERSSKRKKNPLARELVKMEGY